MSISKADHKASGEIAIGPLLSPMRSSSASSSPKEEAFKGHDTLDHHPGTGHGIDPSKRSATFETVGNESYYTPVDNYEGKHRYDPNFEWEPKEERKLVRKVWICSSTIDGRKLQS